MPTLFMLYRPDPTRRTLAFKLAKSGDAVVLIHEGIITTTHAAEEDEIEDLMQRGVKVLALKEKMVQEALARQMALRTSNTIS